MYHLRETHFRSKNTNRLKWKGWKNIFYRNSSKNRAEVAILISDKIGFKSKNITRDNEELYILISQFIKKI